MGLDMYLSVRRSVYLKKGQRTVDLDNVKHDINDYESDKFGVGNGIHIEEGVAYWREANQIHNWFVTNVHDGYEDECQRSVAEEDLQHLYEICKGILDKVNGLKFTLEKEAKDFWDKCNKESEEKGEEPRYKYSESFIFDKNDLEKMYDSNLWCSMFEDKNGAIAKYCKDVLPPREGFFFGTYNVDGGYIFDIVKTALMLGNLFKKMDEYHKNKEWVDIIYQASW